MYNFITETTYGDLPEKSIKTAKLAFLDTIAVSIAGVESDEMRILSEEVIGESNESILQRLENVSAKEFALLFGTLSHVIDYDDVNFTFHGHPSVALIPSIVTYAKYERPLSGKELILSYVIGFETQARIGEDIGDAQYKKGFHATSTLGIFGAAASLTKVMDLSYQQFCNLIGMCVSFSSGVRKNFGTMTKPLHVGLMAENVYFFSNLVRKGFTANAESFSEPMSYANISTGEHNELPSLKKLGQFWESADFGIIVKKYPCCAYTHRSIDGVLKLVKDKKIDVSLVTKIVARVNPKVQSVLIYPNAETPAEGKFSMQYCLSAALIDGYVNLSTFNEDQLKRKSIRGLMGKVEMEIDENQVGINKEQQARVTIYTKNGQYDLTIEDPLGHPNNPLTKTLMEEKVGDCVDDFISKEKKESLFQICEQLPSHTSTDLLRIFL